MFALVLYYVAWILDVFDHYLGIGYKFTKYYEIYWKVSVFVSFYIIFGQNDTTKIVRTAAGMNGLIWWGYRRNKLK